MLRSAILSQGAEREEVACSAADREGRRAVETGDAPEPIGPYSQALVADGVLYCSGQVPLDPETG